MNLKQSTMKVACTLTAFAFISSAAFAYFTDKEAKTNTFTIGSVDIELEEPNWPGDDPVDETEKDLVPGDVVSKDPRVENTGKNDAYVYLEVTIPKATVITANPDGTKNEAANLALFTYEKNDGWTKLDAYTKDDKNTVTYVYAYDEVLKAGETTKTLFDSIEFINVIEGQEIEMTQYVDVVAKAIQSNNVGTVNEAYDILLNQQN